MRLVIIMLLAVGLFAQEQPIPTLGNEEAAIIPVKTLSGDSFNRLATMLKVFNVRFQADEKLRTIVVYAQPAVIAKMRKVVEELDKPGSLAAIGRNIDLTLTLLRCSTKPQEDSNKLPADMEAVAKQLQAATPYKSVAVWETIPLRLQEGSRSEQSLRLPRATSDAESGPPTGELSIIPEAVIQKEGGLYVRFSRFNLTLRVPQMIKSANNSVQHLLHNVSIQTAGDFKEGQKTVVGKLTGMDEDTAVFTVVSLKVLD